MSFQRGSVLFEVSRMGVFVDEADAVAAGVDLGRQDVTYPPF